MNETAELALESNANIVKVEDFAVDAEGNRIFVADDADEAIKPVAAA